MSKLDTCEHTSETGMNVCVWNMHVWQQTCLFHYCGGVNQIIAASHPLHILLACSYKRWHKNQVKPLMQCFGTAKYRRCNPPPSIYIIIWFIRVWNSNPVCCIIAMKDTKTEIYFRSCPGQKPCWASTSSLITAIMGSGRELIWIKEGQTMVANLSSLTGKWRYHFWILWRVWAFFFVSG